MATPCILCKERNGYPATDGLCTRCARSTKLFQLRDIADKAELEWSDYADLLYRIEVWEGLRPPPSRSIGGAVGGGGEVASDRPSPHGVQRDVATGASSPSVSVNRRFSPLMKQGPGRSSLTEDDLT